MNETDIAKIRNYADTKIMAQMNIQEQKALCRLVLDISEMTDKFIEVGHEYPIFKSELEALVRQHKLEGMSDTEFLRNMP